MPKGKGTYGSQVGRPPKDGRQRSVQEYAGGGKTGYSQIGMYKEGGKVETVDYEDKTKRPNKALNLEREREAGKFKLPDTKNLGEHAGTDMPKLSAFERNKLDATGKVVVKKDKKRKAGERVRTYKKGSR
jgi:hypothetical protein